MVECLFSLWRPPLFDTMMASAPRSAARLASSTRMMPFRISLRGHSDRAHAMVFSSMELSRFSLIHSANGITHFACRRSGAMLEKVCDRLASMCTAQGRCSAALTTLDGIRCSGATRPFLLSAQRCEWTWTSSVMTNAETPAASARLATCSVTARSFIM